MTYRYCPCCGVRKFGEQMGGPWKAKELLCMDCRYDANALQRCPRCHSEYPCNCCKDSTPKPDDKLACGIYKVICWDVTKEGEFSGQHGFEILCDPSQLNMVAAIEMKCFDVLMDDPTITYVAISKVDGDGNKTTLAKYDSVRGDPPKPDYVPCSECGEKVWFGPNYHPENHKLTCRCHPDFYTSKPEPITARERCFLHSMEPVLHTNPPKPDQFTHDECSAAWCQHYAEAAKSDRLAELQEKWESTPIPPGDLMFDRALHEMATADICELIKMVEAKRDIVSETMNTIASCLTEIRRLKADLEANQTVDASIVAKMTNLNKRVDKLKVELAAKDVGLSAIKCCCADNVRLKAELAAKDELESANAQMKATIVRHERDIRNYKSAVEEYEAEKRDEGHKEHYDI